MAGESHTALGGAAAQPLSIELDRTKELRIRWADGASSVIPLARLRGVCPCAGCRAERELGTQAALPVVPGIEAQRQMAQAERAELVGRYALRIAWNDGHDTGIYDYGFLRSLQPMTAPEVREPNDEPHGP